MLINALQNLADDELVARIAALNGAERKATAALVAHLAELESRDLHLALGFRSLYGYCRAVLHLSEHESYNRMEAAHVARRFPVIVPMLAEGLLHLTAVRLLAPHLDDEQHLALLGGAIHKSKAEVKELLAGWFPKADVKASIRRVPVPVTGATGSVVPPALETASSVDPVTERGETPPILTDSNAAPAGPVLSSPGTARPPERRKATIDPLSAETYAMRLTARRATIERLRRAQELLSHAVPDGDVDEMLYRALGELIERAEGKIGKRRPAGRTKRRGGRAAAALRRAARTPDPVSRGIPAEVERAVRERDEGRCAFVGRNGKRCDERRFLELHHVKPWAVGGEPTPANIALRCRAHNQYEARVYFAPIRSGMEVMSTRSGTS